MVVKAQRDEGGACLGEYIHGKLSSFKSLTAGIGKKDKVKECVEKVKRVWKRNGEVTRAMTVGVLQCRRITDVQKNAGLGNEYHKRGGKQKTQFRAQICVIIQQSPEKRPASRPNI